MGNSKVQDFSQEVEDYSEDLRVLVLTKMREVLRSFALSLLAEEVDVLCGALYSHKGKGHCHRGGSERGYVRLGGERYTLRRSRVRCDGQEVPLTSYKALQSDDLLQGQIMRSMLSSVSTRNYGPLMEKLASGFGLKKSMVSKSFQRGCRKSLDEINGRDLSKWRFVSLTIDGVRFKDQAVICVLGVTEGGEKLILGLREGSTEHSEVTTDLLQSLVSRGLDPKRKMLFVLDGSKALRKSVNDVFGKKSYVQRCTQHKLENLKKYLPQTRFEELKRRWKKLHGMVSFKDAQTEYKSLLSWLKSINETAYKSLLEAQKETLTLIRLGVSGLLRKTLITTNPIESASSIARQNTNRVKNWKTNPQQITLWTAATLLDSEKRSKKIRGHK